ncbi:MAG: efflux RND transporter permease subunit [Hyphomicrobiales bacterium]
MRDKIKRDVLIKGSYKIILIFILFGLIGFAVIPDLSLRLKPSPKAKNFAVSCYWSDISPQVIDAEIATVLEGVINSLEGVEKLTTEVYKSRCYLNIYLSENVNAEDFRFELSSILRQVYPDLPEGVSYPYIYYAREDRYLDQSPSMTYILNGEQELPELYKLANDVIKPELSQVEFVDKIEVVGSMPYELVFTYDKEHLNYIDVKLSDIKSALRNYFYSEKLGLMRTHNDDNQEVISVRLGNNKAKDADFWKTIPVKNKDGHLFYLKEICNINKQVARQSRYFRLNGKNNIYINVYPTSGANSIKLSSSVLQNIKTIEKALPSSVSLILEEDTSKEIKEELNRIGYRSALTVIVLLIFILIISRNIKYVILVVTSLTINLALCVLLYFLMGIEMNLYSLAALTVSLGLILDNIIVMLDHMKHFKNRNAFMALLASTLTTMAAMSVIFFLPDEYKMDLVDFVIVIIINLGVSLISALFFVPALMDRFPIKGRKIKISGRKVRVLLWFNSVYSYFIRFIYRFRKTVIVIGIVSFGLPVFLLPSNINNKYIGSSIYNNTIGSNVYQEYLKTYVNIIFGGSLRLFVNYVYEDSWHTSDDKEVALNIVGSMGKGSTIEQMNGVFKMLEVYLSKEKGVKQFITRISSETQGSIKVLFTDEGLKQGVQYKVKNKIASKIFYFGGMNWNVYGVGKSFGKSSVATPEMNDFTIVVKGFNLNETNSLALKIKSQLKEHPRVTRVDFVGSDSPWAIDMDDKEFFLTSNPYLLTAYNMDLNSFYRKVDFYNQRSNFGIKAYVKDKFINLRLEPKDKNKMDVWSLQNSPMNGTPISLKNVGNIHKDLADQVIQKEDQQYIRFLQIKYLGIQKYGKKYCQQIVDDMNKRITLGYSLELRDAKSPYLFYQKKERQYSLIILVIALIFMICAVLFESLKQPLAIILLIPFSFSGIFLSFYWFDVPLGEGGYASFLLLCGIVVNTSIYILNEFNVIKRNRKKDANELKLFVKAFNHKVIPVFLTIVSTILGMIPFLLISDDMDFWFMLAVGTIGGLVYSVIINIIFLPLFSGLKIKKK